MRLLIEVRLLFEGGSYYSIYGTYIHYENGYNGAEHRIQNIVDFNICVWKLLCYMHVSIDKANPISTKIYTTWVNKQARTPFSNYHSLYNS